METIKKKQEDDIDFERGLKHSQSGKSKPCAP